VGFSRRALLILGASVPLALASRPVVTRAESTSTASIREWIRGSIERDASGAVSRIFDMDTPMAGEVLLRATKADALPDGYAPRDVVSTGATGIPAAGRQLIRSVIVDDTRALIQEAASAGYNLYVGSGFRSQSYQVDVFAAQVARWGDDDVANRYSARPGHSQHQLGTTIDFTNEFRTFRGSGAPDWLREHAHRFGFVLPYTPAASERTGYIDEPWHSRWVGRMLAGRLQSVGYQDWTDVDVDDVVAMVRTEAGLDA
jgi:LAS superfamily LD-carboxypeptidase LdcB